jgi:hypothetical protein
MSSIGSGPIGISPIVNSAAGVGGQQKSADVNRTQHDAGIQRRQSDRADQFEKTVGDIGESDGTDERDADGRLPWTFKPPGPPSPQQEDASGTSRQHAADLTGERGRTLDLDA